MCLMHALPRNVRTRIRLPISLRYRLCGTLPARTAARRAVAVKRQLVDAFELDVRFAKLEHRVRSRSQGLGATPYTRPPPSTAGIQLAARSASIASSICV